MAFGDGVEKVNGIKHVIITPSKNEENYIPTLIYSMINQTIKPVEWIIIDHGSTDNTSKIIKEAMKKEKWIKYIYIESQEVRNRGAEIAKLFSIGMEGIETDDWAYCSKIDSDMILPEDYFEKIFLNFNNNQKIGILGGNCFIVSKMGKKKIEKVQSDHVRGGLKTYRKECFQDIGGVLIVNGWDGLDEASAQMKGWVTRSLKDLEVEHRRETGKYRGKIINNYISGEYAYFMGYIFPYIFVRSLKKMLDRPYFIGGMFMLLGFSKSKFFRMPVYHKTEVVYFLKKKQARRLGLNKLYRRE